MAYQSPKEILNYDLGLEETTITWIAGLLEGEGTFSIDKRSRDEVAGTPSTVSVILRMSDKDVVQKFANYVKKNVIMIKQTKKEIAEGRKPMYSCYFGDRSTCYYILTKILPYMGERRSKEIRKQIQHIKDWAAWVEAVGRSRSQFNQLKGS